MKILKLEPEDREMIELAMMQYREWREEDYDGPGNENDRAADLARADRILVAIRALGR